MHWPYKNVEYTDCEKAIERVERMLQSFGAVYVEERSECDTWFMGNEICDTQVARKKTFRFRDEYVRVDKVYFADKPFIVLEFGDRIEGPYEDADPFPYDLAAEEVEREVKYLMFPDCQDEKYYPFHR